MKRLILLSASVLLVLATGCADDLPSGPPMSQSTGLIPASVGAKWVYVDSLFEGANVTVTYDTVKVTGSRNDGNLVWWRIEGESQALGVLFKEYSLSNDTVYNIQMGMRMANDTIVAPVFLSPRSAEFTYSMLVGGDAMMAVTVTPPNPQPLTVPAGTYTGWSAYRFGTGLESGAWILKPGVGVIRYELDGVEYPGRPAFRKTSTLVSTN